MRTMPVLETVRLKIRPFLIEDLYDLHHLMRDIEWADMAQTRAEQVEQRRQFLEWASRNHTELAKLYQPPYGDRAITLKETGDFIGMCGFVPYISPFGQMPYFGGQPNALETAEMGLMWAVSPQHQGNGYATEAAQALIEYAFTHMRLKRLIATTEYNNLASQSVMQKVGMLLESNPFDTPPWLQIVGILENTKR